MRIKDILLAMSRESIDVKKFAAAVDVSILDYLKMQLGSFDGASEDNMLWDKFKSIPDKSTS